MLNSTAEVVGILQRGFVTNGDGQIEGLNLVTWWGPGIRADLCRVYRGGGIPGCTATGGARAATTYTVYLGEFAKPPANLQKTPGTINQFLPSRLVIAAGDSVTFASNSFHSVTYNPRPIPLLVPDPKKGTYAGLMDAAGQPFYFDDLPKLIYNPQAFGPSGRGP